MKFVDANGLSALLVAAYILVVLANERQSDLWDSLKQERNFLKWLAAIAILFYIVQNAGLGQVGANFLAIVAVGLALNQSGKIKDVTGAITSAFKL